MVCGILLSPRQSVASAHSGIMPEVTICGSGTVGQRADVLRATSDAESAHAALQVRSTAPRSIFWEAFVAELYVLVDSLVD